MNLSNLREEFDNYVANYWDIEGSDEWERKERIDIKVNNMDNVELMTMLCGTIQVLGDA